MGTNYYAQRNCCDYCGRGDDSLHIGKSSAGWVFALNTHPDEKITSLKDWLKLLSRDDVRIVDEYGKSLELEDLLERILNRHGLHGTPPQRSPIDGHRVVAHGNGTYDLHRGDFS